jgi:hypothetical protein
MLDLVPLGGARRNLPHRDLEPAGVGEAGQFLPSRPAPGSRWRHPRRHRSAAGSPPGRGACPHRSTSGAGAATANTGGVPIPAHRHPAGVGGQVVDAVGHGLVGALLGEVVGADPYRLPSPGASPARPPRCSPSTSLFLVSTLTGGWLAAVNSLTWPLRYRNWGSRSGWRAPSVVREVPSQGEPLGSGQRGHRVRAHRVPLAGQLGGQLPGGPARPAQPGTPGPTLIRLDQRQQGRDQARITLAQPLAARTHRPHPVGRLPPNSRAPRASVDSATRAPRATRRTPLPQHPGSRSQRQAPLPLIQMGQQRGERLPEHHLGLFRHAQILRPNYPIRPISN